MENTHIESAIAFNEVLLVRVVQLIPTWRAGKVRRKEACHLAQLGMDLSKPLPETLTVQGFLGAVHLCLHLVADIQRPKIFCAELRHIMDVFGTHLWLLYLILYGSQTGDEGARHYQTRELDKGARCGGYAITLEEVHDPLVPTVPSSGGIQLPCSIFRIIVKAVLSVAHVVDIVTVPTMSTVLVMFFLFVDV